MTTPNARIELPRLAELADQRLPVSLLTGFLGSGKTTVLSRLLQHPAFSRTAVIINELGEIGLDHDLVAQVDENTVLLRNGCVCCSIRVDLVDTLHDLLERSLSGDGSMFERVVIETTGMADPAPILATLTTDQVLESQFKLDGIIVTVDAATARNTLDRFSECRKQVGMADLLLITKTDLVDRDAVQDLERVLLELNPAAEVLRSHNGVVPAERLLGIAGNGIANAEHLGWLAEGVEHGPTSVEARHGGDVVTASLRVDIPVSMSVLDLWLDSLKQLQGPGLLRMKGLIAVEELEGPMLLHGVQHIFHPPTVLPRWPTDDETTRLVLIARELPKKQLEDVLDFMRNTARAGGLPASRTSTSAR